MKTEPYEEVVIDIPSEFQGTVIDRLGARAFVMTNLTTHGDSVRLLFEGPTRGILGFKNQFVIDTKGEGIFSSRVIGFKAICWRNSKASCRCHGFYGVWKSPRFLPLEFARSW